MEDIKLVTIDGQIINISCSDNVWEEVWTEIQQNFTNQGLWNCGNYDIQADWHGIPLSHIDFHKIIGIM